MYIYNRYFNAQHLLSGQHLLVHRQDPESQEVPRHRTNPLDQNLLGPPRETNTCCWSLVTHYGNILFNPDVLFHLLLLPFGPGHRSCLVDRQIQLAPEEKGKCC